MTYVVALAMTKGGCGKSTAIECIGAELRTRDYTVLGLDADPERRLYDWAQTRADPGFEVLPDVNEHNIAKTVTERAAEFDFVFIDLAGFGNLTMLYAFGKSDLVLIPTLTSAMDLDAAIRTYGVVKDAMAELRHGAPAKVFLNRTPAALQPRVLSHIRKELVDAGLPLLPVELIDRSPLVEMTYMGKGPSEMDQSNRSVQRATENIQAFTDAVLAELEQVELNPGVPRKVQQASPKKRASA